MVILGCLADVFLLKHHDKLGVARLKWQTQTVDSTPVEHYDALLQYSSTASYKQFESSRVNMKYMRNKVLRDPYTCKKDPKVRRGRNCSALRLRSEPAEDHSQGSDFEKVTELDDFDEDLGEGSAVLPL
nr:hypothetical protein Iba_chr04aCG12970 [Ipomoea batatas]